MKKRILILVMITISTIRMAHAQDANWRVGISIVKESFYYPSIYNFTGPFHPGFSFVADRSIKSKKKSETLLALEVGFYHHEYFQNGIFLLAGLNYQYAIKKNLKLRWGPRIGYLHSFSPTGKYQHVDGEYKQVKDFGRPSVLAGITLGVEYPIINLKQSNKVIDIFLDYQVLVEGPFAPKSGVPVVPHTLLGLGLKTQLF